MTLVNLCAGQIYDHFKLHLYCNPGICKWLKLRCMADVCNSMQTLTGYMLFYIFNSDIFMVKYFILCDVTMKYPHLSF